MANNNVAVTELIHGPFCVVVTDPKDPNSKDYPVVVAPSGGFGTTDEAVQFIELFANRKQPYLGLHFRVAQLTPPGAFVTMCSWED